MKMPVLPTAHSPVSRFQLVRVNQRVGDDVHRDVCRETCSVPTPPPNTCKLECHSGAPLLAFREEIPVALS